MQADKKKSAAANKLKYPKGAAQVVGVKEYLEDLAKKQTFFRDAANSRVSAGPMWPGVGEFLKGPTTVARQGKKRRTRCTERLVRAAPSSTCLTRGFAIDEGAGGAGGAARHAAATAAGGTTAPLPSLQRRWGSSPSVRANGGKDARDVGANKGASLMLAPRAGREAEQPEGRGATRTFVKRARRLASTAAQIGS